MTLWKGAPMLPVDEQMRIITSGAAKIVPEADLKKKLERGVPLNIKLGVDPTSPDLHLGHAVPLRKMRQFQDLGHRVTLIIGNGTATIGDPSGKNSTRPQLTQEEVEANAATYVSQAMKILDPEKTTIVHNGDWMFPMGLKELLSIASKFTVARILERDDFTKRYQSQTPIALHEFLYPIMQAYDSVKIEADVEMGGNDQWSNMLAGTELIRRKLGEDASAMTITLLLNSEGKKMGKTQSGAVWLDPNKTSPFDFYQYWRNVADADVLKCIRMLTFLPLEEIDKMDSWEGAQLNTAKEILAFELTKLVHGEEEAQKAQESARALFSQGNAAQMPTAELTEEDFENGEIDILTLLLKSGLVPSKSEARRAVQQGGVAADGEKVADIHEVFTKDALSGDGIVLKKGKKNFRKVVVK